MAKTENPTGGKMDNVSLTERHCEDCFEMREFNPATGEFKTIYICLILTTPAFKITINEQGKVVGISGTLEWKKPEWG